VLRVLDQIVLLSVEGLGTNAIIRETDKFKTCVWRRQERFVAEGVEGLQRNKTRRTRIAKLDPSTPQRVVELTMEEPPGETTHWTGAAMADAIGVSISSVQRIWRARAPTGLVAQRHRRLFCHPDQAAFQTRVFRSVADRRPPSTDFSTITMPSRNPPSRSQISTKSSPR
jgi:hypothetical protein